ncbi:hypothetical protein CVV38_03485 [Candidatus Peregrinibacteria bacterium HGW-Peregrinibacteria-1]|jgi:hypothetical protein|nr:MAG: hypothetical protein CVV38_03485 [Candidatus Peregrinibacteria bacterium HGW-Peregrinibacteria-1]
MRFLILVLGSYVAYLLLRYRERIKNFTGDIGFAEKVFGSGGTYTFIVLVGILVFIFSLMYALGTFESFLNNVWNRIF